MVVWGLSSVSGGTIDLYSTSVDARIVDFAAEVQIIQIYASNSASRCEGVTTT